MKKTLYIILFMILGGMITLLIHAALEIPALALIERQLSETGDSWLWRNWGIVHGVGGSVLTLSGLVFGFFAGKMFWRILYVEKRRGRQI